MPSILSQPKADAIAFRSSASRWQLIFATLLWAIPAVVISLMLAKNPEHRTVSGSYHLATQNWWAGQDIYVGPQGMNYFPHFVILYTPFHFLPLAACEVLWRLVALATIGFGLRELLKNVFPDHAAKAFLLASILAIPLSLGAVRNGNSNAVFGGVIIWAIVAILNERWWPAALLTILSIMIKPLGIVLFFLAPLHYAKMRVPLIVAFVAMLIFPFCFGNPAYVWSQHKAMAANLQKCAVVTDHRFADINGIFRTFSVEMPEKTSKAVRVLAGALTALAWWWGARRLDGNLRALWLLALVTSYLMLFNPMTEANSYSILAPALAAWAAVFVFASSESAVRPYGWIIATMTLSMGVLPNIVRPMFGNYFALLWHPLMTIAFLVILLCFIEMRPKNA
jgi:alpha-1,2-mannosyltransferase